MKIIKHRKLRIPEPSEWSKKMRESLKILQAQIDMNGRVQMNIDGLTIYCYSAELTFILTANEFDAINLDTNEKEEICGSEWLQSFVDGYRKGIEDFKSNHKASPDTLHGAGSAVYIESLIYLYEEAPNKLAKGFVPEDDIENTPFEISSNNEKKRLGAGWQIVRSIRLHALHHDTLKKIGYYSALTSEYLEIKTNNPKLFASPSILETKTQRLKSALAEVGFFELPMVQILSEPNKLKLVELIGFNKMPYGIAMLDYLNFLTYFDKAKGTKKKANLIVSRLFNEKAKDDTSAKHYRSSLVKPRPRYNASEYKQTVISDYQKLK
jgi:hypothetical protein